jgi:hypothetical protein
LILVSSSLAARGVDPVVFLMLQVVTVLLVAVTMSLVLAHTLELPDKMRLEKETYIPVQAICYPGFTLGGFGEGPGTLATLILLFMTPQDATGRSVSAH